jgi:hypothetical protein
MATELAKFRSGARRRGYVLLIVLAVSVLVVTVLSTLAQVSLRRGLQAADAERDLQQRWGGVTLQEALLKDAPKVFLAQEERAAELTPGVPPPPTIRDAITLGGVTFDMLLGDEDAKLNLNTVYHQSGKMKTEQVLAKVQPRLTRAIRLVPAVKPMQLSRESRRDTDEEELSEQPQGPPRALRSWGEVFDIGRLKQDLASEAALPTVTSGITCWGGGQLNFRRATDDAILAVAGSVIQDGAASRLLQRYRQNPTVGVDTLLLAEVQNQQKRERLTRLLSQTSNNFSLWMNASASDGQSVRRFIVMNRDDEGVIRYEQFEH